MQPAETPGTPPLISLRNFVVLRDETPLFVPVSFDLHARQSLQIKAVNGGGKTTLLRCLYGLAIDYQGEVLLYGKPAATTALRHQAAYMNDRAGVYGHLTTEENLDYMLLLHAIRLERNQREETLARVGLLASRRLLARRLSKGQKKRLHLARLRLLDKPMWLLDEPFDGLDTQGRELLRDMLAAHIAAGGAVVFSSHLDAHASYQSHLLLELLGLEHPEKS